MIVERIEYVVNTTTRFVVDLWVRHWPLLLLTSWAVVDFLDTDDSIRRLVFAASFVGTVACLKAFHLERCFWIYGLAFMGFPFVAFDPANIREIIAVRLRVKKKVQNLNAMWYKEFAKNFATQGDFGHESP